MEIKKGNKGQDIVDIQRRLAYLGYDLGLTQIDGFFAERTEAAVRQFQKDRHLPVTGVVDEKTWRCLVESTYRLGDRALYLRSPFFRGDDVKQLQKWLNTLGFRTELIDGVFGPSTERAVREFQENIGLTCDGIVGPETVAALNNLRFILDKKRPAAFPAFNSANSIIELLASRFIGIGCSAPPKKQWLASKQSLELICLDIAYRLSNLLETLGAQTAFFTLGQPLGEAELNVAFLPLKKQPNTVVIETLANQSSQKLASLLQQKLKNLGGEHQLSFQQAVLNIQVASLDSKGISSYSAEMVYVTLKIGKLELFKAASDLQKEIGRQKFASAVFDALTGFLERQNS